MEHRQLTPAQWAETVAQEDFAGLRAAENRVLAAGVPGEPDSVPRTFNLVRIVVAILMFVVPLAGWVAFIESAVFFQDEVLRIIRLDLDPEARLWMGGVSFAIASVEVLWLFLWWWRHRRERDGLLAGFMFGIGVFAALALVQIARGSDAYLPNGFDVRVVPIVAPLIIAGVTGLIMLLGLGHGVRRPADPAGPAVSRSEHDAQSPGEMNALLDARRYVLQILAQRGIADADVDEIDRKPLGSLQ